MSEPAARKRLRKAREQASAERGAAGREPLSEKRMMQIRLSRENFYKTTRHTAAEMTYMMYVADLLEELDRLAELRTELARVKAELGARIAAESADAAAGSYAGRAEEAEAEVKRLRDELSAAHGLCDATQTTLNAEFELSCRFRTERDVATARSEKAEAALAEMRERLAELGEPETEWGHQIHSRRDDYVGDAVPQADETAARYAVSHLNTQVLPWHLRATLVRHEVLRYETEWRDADATLCTALERAADEQGDGEGDPSA